MRLRRIFFRTIPYLFHFLLGSDGQSDVQTITLLACGRGQGGKGGMRVMFCTPL